MRRLLFCVVLLLESLAVAQGQPSGYLASTTTVTPGTWEEQLELGLAMQSLRTTLTACFAPEGFTGGTVTVEFTERWMFSGRLTFGSTGYTGCGLEAQASVGEKLVLLGKAEWGTTGFTEGELGVLFNPGAPGFQAVSVGGMVEFDRLGLRGQEISFLADLEVLSVETLCSFSSVGFEGLSVRAEAKAERLGGEGCITLIQGESLSIEVGVYVLFENAELRGRGLFDGQGLREAQGELSWAFAEGVVLAGSVLVRPVGIAQSVAELSLTGDWYRFTGALWFISAGLHEANATLTMMIADWATASASAVVREATLATATVGAEIGLKGIQVFVQSVWDGTGFRELRLRVEIPFSFETPS